MGGPKTERSGLLCFLLARGGAGKLEAGGGEQEGEGVEKMGGGEGLPEGAARRGGRGGDGRGVLLSPELPLGPPSAWELWAEAEVDGGLGALAGALGKG